MKNKSVFLLEIIGAILLLNLGLYLLLFANQATTPDSIARKAGLKLPTYEITKADNNMDRTASAWSYYCFEIKFKEPLSETYLRRVEKNNNCWREGETYIVSDESPDNWSAKVHFFPMENRATIEYEFWDSLF